MSYTDRVSKFFLLCSPESHRRTGTSKLQTHGLNALRFRPIAKKDQIFLFFRIGSHRKVKGTYHSIPYESVYKFTTAIILNELNRQ
jgi:hypothetical protein